MGVPDGAGRERTAILPAGCQELGVPIGDMSWSQPLQSMVAQIWDDHLRDEPAVFLSRLASEPMEATEPGAQIIGDHGLARLDQGAVMGGSDQPGKLALGILALAAHSYVAGLPPAASGIRKIVFNAPAIPTAPDNVPSTHDLPSSPFPARLICCSLLNNSACRFFICSSRRAITRSNSGSVAMDRSNR